jgi:hypothetical protein
LESLTADLLLKMMAEVGLGLSTITALGASLVPWTASVFYGVGALLLEHGNGKLMSFKRIALLCIWHTALDTIRENWQMS